MSEALREIESAVVSALGTYSNVHRGSGHHSIVTTRLFERARSLVLDFLGLSEDEHVVVFCSPRRATRLAATLAAGDHRCVSSQDVGLPLGLRALAIRRKALPKGAPFETGGGTARLVAPGWVIWAKAPDRFEAGTPAIINVIAFARALQLKKAGTALAPIAGTDDVAEPDTLDGLAGAELLTRLRETLIGRSLRVPTAAGDRSYVNLDNAASTPTFAPIWQAVRRSWRMPCEQHQAVVQQAKSVCAEVLGAPLTSHDVLFTSNTTEAINLVAESLGRRVGPDLEPVVLSTFLEHNSNELPWRALPGVALVRVPMDQEGFIDPAELEVQLRAYNQTRAHGSRRIELVAISGASNVLGSYNDIEAIGRIAHQYGARLLVDGAQYVAHRRMDMEALGIDYLALSGHKVYAPFGTGVLLARKGLLAFSSDERCQIEASGQENVGGIAGLAKALQLLHRIGFQTIHAEEQELTRRALSGLARLPRVRVYGVKSADSPRFDRKGGVIVFDVKGRLPGGVARALAESGIGVRYGCHCAHLTIKRVLRVPKWAEQLQYALVHLIPGFSPPGLVRVSFGLQTMPADVDTFIEQLGTLNRHRQSKELRRQMASFVDAACDRVFGALPAQVTSA